MGCLPATEENVKYVDLFLIASHSSTTDRGVFKRIQQPFTVRGDASRLSYEPLAIPKNGLQVACAATNYFKDMICILARQMRIRRETIAIMRMTV